MRIAVNGYRAVALLLAVSSLVGCASIPMEAPRPSLQNLETIRNADMGSVGVGEFVLAPGKPLSLDKSVSVRSNKLYPDKQSFAQYLADTLKAELVAAGKYDEASPVLVKGQLTDSFVDGSGTTEGNARLGARFTVSDGEQKLYDKELTESARWPSAFMGVEAVPAAMNGYTALYQKLVGKLLADPAFAEATRRAPPLSASQP